MNVLAKELDALLEQDVSDVLVRQRAYWHSATKLTGDNIVLFGAGALGRHTFAGMRKAGMVPLAFADNGEAVQGTEIDGIPVISPEDAVAKYGTTAAFVIATYNTSKPREQLSNLGAVTVVHFAWLFASRPEAFLPHVCLELPHPIFEQKEDVRRGFELMADEEMRRLYLAQLRWRLFLDFDRALTSQTPAMRNSEYFPDDLYSFLPNEVLVDCGAFQGDTVQRFLAKQGDSFARIYACEPDSDNRKHLEEWLSSLPGATHEKIIVEPVAVGAERGKARFTSGGDVRSLLTSDGTLEVNVATIDEITRVTPPTLIKMDIEGAELDALSGARHSIEKYAPVLAICVYHTSDHLWRVPLLIASLSSRYRFYLRAHAEDCWDATCYAIPIERALRK